MPEIADEQQTSNHRSLLGVFMSRQTLEFVKAAIRNPLEVSTVFPTSRQLAKKLLDVSGTSHAEKVVELGTGTGAITRHLAPILRDPVNYIGVELDPKMVEYMRREYRSLRFEPGLASDLGRWVADASIDVVISSLPWSLFSEDTQEKTIAAIHTALRDGGSFTTYICANAMLSPLAGAFLRRLRETFKKVDRSPLEWRNLPPAYVYRAVK